MLYCVVVIPVIFTRFKLLNASAINCHLSLSNNLISLAIRRSSTARPGYVYVFLPIYGTRELPPTPNSPEAKPLGEGFPETEPEYGKPSDNVRIPENWKPSKARRTVFDWNLLNGGIQYADIVNRLRWSKSDRE